MEPHPIITHAWWRTLFFVGVRRDMAVDPGRQARGLGRVLLEHAHAAGRGAGMITLLLEATPSGQRLYEKLGYVADHETWIVSRSRVAPSASSGGGSGPG
jgi:GNAT superfamily N-acetyltransferase